MYETEFPKTENTNWRSFAASKLYVCQRESLATMSSSKKNERPKLLLFLPPTFFQSLHLLALLALLTLGLSLWFTYPYFLRNHSAQFLNLDNNVAVKTDTIIVPNPSNATHENVHSTAVIPQRIKHSSSSSIDTESKVDGFINGSLHKAEDLNPPSFDTKAKALKVKAGFLKPNSQVSNPSSNFTHEKDMISLASTSPYHNWDYFAKDFQEMLQSFKIYVYPDVNSSSFSSPFANIFNPHPNPFNPRLGNYFSEHMFKISLLHSSLLTRNPSKAHFFYMPFSINNLRNDPRVRADGSIAKFVANYTDRIRREFVYWNASNGADHFYVQCHSVGRDAASKSSQLLNNAVQVTCSSNYFQRLYIAHKDVSLPQVWPRKVEEALIPPEKRDKLVFFSGRIQNSQIRQELISLWENDTSMDIFSKRLPFPYEEGFKRSRYCLHVKGYEVNTARVSDAIQYGCVPVIISNYYDLPFANVLDWSKFSVTINHGDIGSLKEILLSIPKEAHANMYHNLCQIRRHFVWHKKPVDYDSFLMTAYQLWLRRGVHHLSHLLIPM